MTPSRPTVRSSVSTRRLPTPGNISGSAYATLDRHDDAIEAFRQATRINAEDADAWKNLGLAYATLDRHDDAIEAFRQATRINPEDALVWYNRGVTYSELKCDDDAIAAYRQALRVNPEFADAWHSLGKATPPSIATMTPSRPTVRSPYQPGGCRRLVQPRARVRHPRSPR